MGQRGPKDGRGARQAATTRGGRGGRAGEEGTRARGRPDWLDLSSRTVARSSYHPAIHSQTGVRSPLCGRETLTTDPSSLRPIESNTAAAGRSTSCLRATPASMGRTGLSSRARCFADPRGFADAAVRGLRTHTDAQEHGRGQPGSVPARSAGSGTTTARRYREPMTRCQGTVVARSISRR